MLIGARNKKITEKETEKPCFLMKSDRHKAGLRKATEQIRFDAFRLTADGFNLRSKNVANYGRSGVIFVTRNTIIVITMHARARVRAWYTLGELGAVFRERSSYRRNRSRGLGGGRV